MTKTVAVMARVSAERKGQLKAMARSTRRSESFLAAEAIAAYLDHNAWQVETIARALDAAHAEDAGFVPHDEVAAWSASLGTAKRRSRPRG